MAEKFTSYSAPSELTLTLGVDGSGKSTFLKGLADNLGYSVIEPTSSPEARLFKLANIDNPVDSDFVNKRENIFLRLNRDFDTQIRSIQETNSLIATTGNGFVTQVSHGVMRSIVDTNHSRSINDIVADWADSDMLKPATVVLIHAPATTIRERILARQEDGDVAERFWGFNSPHFLTLYQDGLMEAVEALGRFTSIRHYNLDSQVLTPREMLEVYKQLQ